MVLIYQQIMEKKKLGEATWYERAEQAPKQFRNSWDDTMYPLLESQAQEAKLERWYVGKITLCIHI